jgi:hypothetical protein
VWRELRQWYCRWNTWYVSVRARRIDMAEFMEVWVLK